MDTSEAIMHFKNFFDKDTGTFCIDFIKHRKNQSSKLTVVFDKEVINTDIRDVNGYRLCLDKPSDLFVFYKIKVEIERMITNYLAKFPKCEYHSILQIDLLHYTHGGKYDYHQDAIRGSGRNISCIINLNENYEGGDLCFMDSSTTEKTYKLRKNDIIMFPSNFLYAHKINKITKGERYSIVAWLD